MSYEVFTKDGRPAGTLRVTARGPRRLVEYASDLDPGVSRLVLAGPSGAVSLGIPTQYAGGLRLTRTLTRLSLGEIDLDGECRAFLVPAGEDISALTLASCPPAPEPSDETAGEGREESLPDPQSLQDTQSAQDPSPAPETAPVPEPEALKAEKCPERVPEDVWRPEPDPARCFRDPELAASAGRIREALTRPAGDDTLLAFPWTPSAPFPMIEAFRLGTAEKIGGREYMVFRLRDGQPV